MRQTTYVLVAALVALSSACSHRVWEDRMGVSPISYKVPQGQDVRSVGSLRRLVIAPIRFQEGKNIWHWSGSRTTQEAIIQRSLLGQATNHLSRDKGYDAIPLEVYEDMYPQVLGLSPEGMLQYMDLLAEWALESSDGEAPTAEIVNIVTKIGRPLNMDGLVIIQGATRHPNITSILAVLTASLSWPLIFLEGKVELQADMYEVASGRIVWRSKVRDASGEDLRGWMIGRLFEELEPAVPPEGRTD